MSIHEKFAKLRELYPEDIERIQAEGEHVQGLLEQQEYYQLPSTQALLTLCRNNILAARVKLATERKLDEEARAELWHIIDAREWFLRIVAKDYEAELAAVEQQLDADLSSSV